MRARRVFCFMERGGIEMRIKLLVFCFAIGVVDLCAADVNSSDVSDTTQMVVRVTGYCNCGKCCGWRRSWFGFGPPVYTYGKMKGSKKKIGVTATGTVAKKGTIAADWSVFPVGTSLDIPGYGVGVVEDIGGGIVGNHIDVWFPSHEAAIAWGNRMLTLKIRQ